MIKSLNPGRPLTLPGKIRGRGLIGPVPSAHPQPVEKFDIEEKFDIVEEVGGEKEVELEEKVELEGKSEFKKEASARGIMVVGGDRMLRKRHRLTTVERAFIVKLICAGKTNAHIHAQLRTEGFIQPGEPDISHDTLLKIRSSPDCQLDPSLLTVEARQVGHHKFSECILIWAELTEAATAFLLHGESFGDVLEAPKRRECITILEMATKLFGNTFAAGIGAQVKQDREAGEALNAEPIFDGESAMENARVQESERMLGGSYSSVPQDRRRELDDYIRTIAVAALEGALRDVDARHVDARQDAGVRQAQ